MLQNFDEFTNFCFEHGGTLRNHRVFGEMIGELRKELVQLIADAEQCVQSEQMGQDTDPNMYSESEMKSMFYAGVDWEKAKRHPISYNYAAEKALEKIKAAQQGVQLTGATCPTHGEPISDLIHYECGCSTTRPRNQRKPLGRKPMDEIIKEYSKNGGAYEVWRSWRDKMISQGREVAEKFLELPIPEQDIELDATIAEDVVKDFLVWVEAYHGFCLTPRAHRPAFGSAKRG